MDSPCPTWVRAFGTSGLHLQPHTLGFVSSTPHRWLSSFSNFRGFGGLGFPVFHVDGREMVSCLTS